MREWHYCRYWKTPSRWVGPKRPSTVKPRLHSFGPDSEQISCLLDTQTLNHPSNEDDPVQIGQFVDGPLNELQDLSLCHRLLRIVVFEQRKLNNLSVPQKRARRTRSRSPE